MIVVGLVALAAGSGGALLLRRAWRSRDDRNSERAAGWGLLAGGLATGLTVIDGVRGMFAALAIVSVGALVTVAQGAQWRAARAGRAGRDSLAPEPAERLTTAWQRTLRWLLAGPIGMVAAMAVGIAWSTWIPGEPQTRLLIGGLLVPVAWGGAMAWTLADDRIVRATAVLVGTAIAGFALSILKGFT